MRCTACSPTRPIRSLSGTNVARDFVEFPSQFNEHWALDPEGAARTMRCTTRPARRSRRRWSTRSRRPRPSTRAMRWANCWRRPQLDMQWHTPAAGRAEAGRRRVRGQGARRDRRSTSPMCRRAIAPAISCTSGPTAMRPAITPISGPQMLDHDAYRLVRAQWRPDPRQRPALPRHDPVARAIPRITAPMFRAFYGKDPDVGPLLKDLGLATDGTVGQAGGWCGRKAWLRSWISSRSPAEAQERRMSAPAGDIARIERHAASLRLGSQAQGAR